MADYTGVAIPIEETQRHNAHLLYGELKRYCFKWRMTDAESHGGSYSMCVHAGGQYEIPFACEAGSKTVTVWVKAAIGSNVFVKIDDLNGNEQDSEQALAVSGDWEQLTLNFTAQKAIYILKLENPTSGGGDRNAYFDDILP